MSIKNTPNIADLSGGNIPKIIFCEEGEKRQELISELANYLKVQFVDVITFLSQDGVERLREALKLLNITPDSGFKIFVLLDADSLNDEQANTLLKTLEEPPSYAKIFLFAKSINRILPTIRSRCQKTFLLEKDTRSDSKLLELFETVNFNEFCKFLKNIENNQAKELLLSMLAQMKKRGLNDSTSELYKRAAQSLIKINCTNVSQKLLLENIFVWWKTKKS